MPKVCKSRAISRLSGCFYKNRQILREYEHKSEEKYINVNVKTAFVRINLSSLLYVEVIRHNLVYHTADDKITAYGTMKTLSEELEPHYFVMCNSCYLVNLAFVKKADNKDVYLKNGEVLAISQSKRKNFRLAVARYFGGDYLKMETFLSYCMAPLMAVEILFVLFLIAKSFERKEFFYVRFFGGAFVCVFVAWL